MLRSGHLGQTGRTVITEGETVRNSVQPVITTRTKGAHPASPLVREGKTKEHQRWRLG